MAVRSDLALAAVESARVARAELADALHALERELTTDARGAEVRHRTTQAVGWLYTVELGDAARIHRGLATARDELGRLLSELQRAEEGPPELLAVIARALTRLHPSSRAVARALGLSDDDSVARGADEGPAPIPLARRRPARPGEAPAAPAPDRRASGRVELRVEIGLSHATNFYTGTSGDLSEGGVFVSTSEVLPVDTRVTLSFVLPDGSEIETPSRVAWVRRPSEPSPAHALGMGLAFESLSDADRAAIERFMAQRAPLRLA